MSARLPFASGRTSGARGARGAPGVLSFISHDRPSPVRPHPTHCIAGATGMNNKPTYLSRDGLEKLRAELDEMTSRQASRSRQPHPRREGTRRPVGERRVRGRQERAGVRRGPDPDARGAHQERHDHRREPLDRPRPDRLHGRGREPGRRGDLHDRRLGRGAARRRPDLEREPGRPRAARQEEGREGPRAACRRATSPTRSSASR